MSGGTYEYEFFSTGHRRTGGECYIYSWKTELAKGRKTDQGKCCELVLWSQWSFLCLLRYLFHQAWSSSHLYRPIPTTTAYHTALCSRSIFPGTYFCSQRLGMKIAFNINQDNNSVTERAKKLLYIYNLTYFAILKLYFLICREVTSPIRKHYSFQWGLCRKETDEQGVVDGCNAVKVL